MFKQIGQSILLAACVVVSGCNTSDMSSTSAQQYNLGSSGGSGEARGLVPGDTIQISVEVDGSMEVSAHQAEINHQGVVTLPLVGDVNINDMKLSAARDVIAKTYRAYYVNPPVVMLELMDGNAIGEWGFVTVLGRVVRPGPVPLPSQKGINLSAAIQAAGGFASSAKTSDIRVSRTDELGLKTRVSVDFEGIGKAGNADADILLIDGDIVHVPERIF